MSTKITLYSDEELINSIKLYAKEHNTSVSKIVNNFFKNLLQKENPDTKRSKITDSLIGKLKNIDEDTYKDYLQEKYL
ncbi:MAG: Unknown protein [uncultured Sulfurovum sp.]|uniref:Antitoxin n=1 Tax=uncultured Sulfurovum sp. TaxID=269237 RepID=A0A6S6S7V5_9BACT|nr:MAG: Unknown protein [uncultured Sulfurovum sp.]